MAAGAGPVKGLQLVESLARSEGLIVDAPIIPYTAVILSTPRAEVVISLDAGTRSESLEAARLYLLARRRERLALHQSPPPIP